MQAGAIAAPVQPAPEQPKPPPPLAEEPAKKKPGGVVKKPPAKPADAGEGGGGGAPEPPTADPESKPVKKPAVKKVGVVICIKAWVNVLPL